MTPTIAQVNEALRRVSDAKNAARHLCRRYAINTTGWKPGDQIFKSNGENAEVIHFVGERVVEGQLTIVPVVKVKHLKGRPTDTKSGVRYGHITIDLGGDWRRWKTKESSC